MIRSLMAYLQQNNLLGNRLNLAIRLLVTCLILWLILKSTNRQQTWAILKNADITILAWAILAQLTSTTLAAYRWQLIMHNLQFGMNFHFYWRSYFKGMFFNQALPTSIGGDAIKILDLSRKHFRKRDAFYGVMIDRIIGLVALLALSLFAYVLSPDILPKKVYLIILWLNVSALAGFFSLRFIYKIPLIRQVPKLSDFLQTISRQLAKTFTYHKCQIITSSLLIPFLAVLGFFLTGWSLGLRYDLMTYFLIIPPAIIFTILPISIAGWGIREGALVTLFNMVGADASVVLMMSIAYGFTLILVSLPGLYIFLHGRHTSSS